MAVQMTELTSKSNVTRCSLDQLSKEEQGTIIQAPQNSQLATLGIRKGKVLQLKAKQVFQGPLICSVNGRNLAVSREVAEHIWVEKRD